MEMITPNIVQNVKKISFFLNENGEGNCIDNCPNGTYNNIVNCTKCHDNCKTCKMGPQDINENCESCESDKYLVKAEGYNRNCVDECPNGTNITNIIDILYCTIPDEPKNKEEKEKDSLISYIYIIFIGVSLLILSIYIYKNICSSNKKDSKIITQIHKELQENNKLID